MNNQTSEQQPTFSFEIKLSSTQNKELEDGTITQTWISKLTNTKLEKHIARKIISNNFLPIETLKQLKRECEGTPIYGKVLESAKDDSHCSLQFLCSGKMKVNIHLSAAFKSLLSTANLQPSTELPIAIENYIKEKLNYAIAAPHRR